MSHLPVIIGFGGINAAGRTSAHHAYRRMVLEQLDASCRQETILSLATLTGLVRFTDGQWLDLNQQPIQPAEIEARFGQQVLNNTLIRRIHSDWFDVNAVPASKRAKLQASDQSPISFMMRERQLPEQIPSSWHLDRLGNGQVEITIAESADVLLPDRKKALVQSAGMLPTGFDPASLYRSAHHPRGLQMAVFGASDALGMTGLDWNQIRQRVHPDQVSVYAGNSIGQLDEKGFGGLLQAALAGKRVTSKQMPLGYAQMPADFINAYVLGNVGSTAALMGACASFLYNLQAGMDDIRSGRRRVVLVGSSDAPVTPEIIEGFRTMGALADDASLQALDQLEALTDEHYRRACRPFSSNCGFTIAEAAQFVLLMDDELSLELGTPVYGSIGDVFVNADGFKKSISAPGIGNYLTMSKAVARARAILGEEAVRQRSFVHAHGTSTPKNRVTESHVLNEVAKAFGIENWPLAAIKCYVGHSQGAAGGDQLTNALGTWAYGYIPGIGTIDHVAEDVHQSNLNISPQATETGSEGMDMAFINAKGFGGNNASALVLAPHVTRRMLEQKHGKAAMTTHAKRAEAVQEKVAEYQQQALRGQFKPIYHFGEHVLEGEELQISANSIRIPGYEQPVNLELDNPYTDMT